MIVGGIDPSYSCTSNISLDVRRRDADVDVDGEGLDVRTTTKSHPVHPGRLVHIRSEVAGFWVLRRPALVAIENYAFGAKNRREQAGELGGQIRVALWEAGITYANVAIPTLKAFVAGKGNADKALMLLKVYQRWGYEATNDNQADAYGLARFADQLLQPRETWTKRFAQLAKKVEIVEGRCHGVRRAS